MLRSGRACAACLIALVSTLSVLPNTQSATAPEPGDLRGVGKVVLPDIMRARRPIGFRSRRSAASLVFLRRSAPRVHFRCRTRSEMCDGTMGNRHDLVASDLDASKS